jgi:hypothetical protein
MLRSFDSAVVIDHLEEGGLGAADHPTGVGRAVGCRLPNFDFRVSDAKQVLDPPARKHWTGKAAAAATECNRKKSRCPPSALFLVALAPLKSDPTRG